MHGIISNGWCQVLQRKRGLPRKGTHMLDPFLAELCPKSHLEWNSSEFFCFQVELEEQKWVYISAKMLMLKALNKWDISRDVTLPPTFQVLHCCTQGRTQPWSSPVRLTALLHRERLGGQPVATWRSSSCPVFWFTPSLLHRFTTIVHWRAASFSKWVPVCYLISLSPLLPSLSEALTWWLWHPPKWSCCFCPRSLRYILKTADRGILVRCKSDCASPLVKTLGWCPISLGAKASLVTWGTTHLLFLCHCSSLHSLCSSHPASDSLVTHGLGAFALAASCLQSSSPKCQKFAPSLPLCVYLLKCHLLSKPFPGTQAQIKTPPPIPALASFFSVTLITT